MRGGQNAMRATAALRGAFCVGVLLAAVALGDGAQHLAMAQKPAQSAATQQLSFDSADQVAQALVAAMQARDTKKVLAILGPGSARLIQSGDKVAEDAARQRFLDAFQEKHQLQPAGPDRMILEVGPDDWPLPMPIVASSGKWRFDSVAGVQELIDRRIGRNELAAIGVMLAYVDAQKDFAERDKQAGGPGAFATRLYSTPGKHDGLYWPSAPGEPESPMGKLVAKFEAEGYPGEPSKGPPVPYQGYFFRLLKAQGPNAPGGEKDYMVNGQLTGGFALIAWPAVYGSSGIMTFIVNQDRVVFQDDLGPRTASIVQGITRYDPGIEWARIDVVEQ
jgi:hypothetical protein